MLAKRTVAITNESGLHFRAWLSFIKLAQSYESTISVTRNGIIVDGKQMGSLAVIARGTSELCGGVIEIEAFGDDAEDAAMALCKHVEGGFGEGRQVGTAKKTPDSR